MKKLSRSKLIKKLDKIFSIYIRKRYAINEIAQCFTCGKKDHYKRLQCGHFQSRKFYATRWDVDNCKVQCKSCNVYKYGEQYKYSLFLGKEVSEVLYLKSKEIVKFANSDLEDMIKDYSQRLKKLT